MEDFKQDPGIQSAALPYVNRFTVISVVPSGTRSKRKKNVLYRERMMNGREMI
jgi:hypothetical protein